MPSGMGLFLRIVLLTLSCICILTFLITIVKFFMLILSWTCNWSPCKCIDCQVIWTPLCPNGLYGSGTQKLFVLGFDDAVKSNLSASEWSSTMQDWQIMCALVWNFSFRDSNFLAVRCGPHNLYISYVVFLLALEC